MISKYIFIQSKQFCINMYFKCIFICHYTLHDYYLFFTVYRKNFAIQSTNVHTIYSIYNKFVFHTLLLYNIFHTKENILTFQFTFKKMLYEFLIQYFSGEQIWSSFWFYKSQIGNA